MQSISSSPFSSQINPNSQYMADLQRLKERKEALLRSKGFSTDESQQPTVQETYHSQQHSLASHSSNFTSVQNAPLPTTLNFDHRLTSLDFQNKGYQTTSYQSLSSSRVQDSLEKAVLGERPKVNVDPVSIEQSDGQPSEGDDAESYQSEKSQKSGFQSPESERKSEQEE